MQQQSRLKFLIFSMIGVFNTLFDLALYVIVDRQTHSILIANIVSTSAALIGSYLLNSKLTFKSKQWTAKSFALFIVVTLVGLWVLQTALIYVLTPVLKHIPEVLWHHAGQFEATAKTLLPKIVATGATFVWNYLWYSKVIFKGESRQQQVVTALEEL